MFVKFLTDKFRACGPLPAIVWQDDIYDYNYMLAAVEKWAAWLRESSIADNSVVSLECDFSPNAAALLIALVDCGCTIVPLTPSVGERAAEFRQISEVETRIILDQADRVSQVAVTATKQNPLLQQLKSRRHPGLVLFSSGSTGKSKAALHDFVPLLEKFKLPRHTYRTIAFLLFDHIGGVNTLFYTLANGGCLITVAERSPKKVCDAIEKFRAEVLPTSPTFVNLLLLSESYKGRDLSSLKMVTYGTEVMSETTLKKFRDIFPHVNCLQTYGLSELGILRSKSKSSDSLWVKIGGEGFETRVVEGLLEIKAQSAMLGYLNAPSPFTADGWFQTGDAVEVDGEYLKILGRKSEMINVGGEKVYPIEIESALMEMPGVIDVSVVGEKNALTGQIVKAFVNLNTGETGPEFTARMRGHFKGKMAPFKIPQRVVLSENGFSGERFKKIRLEKV